MTEYWASLLQNQMGPLRTFPALLNSQSWPGCIAPSIIQRLIHKEISFQTVT